MRNRSIASQLKEQTLESISLSTWHGIPKIVQTKNKFLKAIWALCFFVSFGYCSYFVTHTFMNYFEYPVITNINNVYDRAPQFPTVMICSERLINDENFLKECSFNALSCLNSTFLEKIDSNCYAFNKGIDRTTDSIPLNSLAEGVTYGYNTLLHNDDPDNFFNVYIYNFTTHFHPSEAIKVSDGFETNLVIKRLYETKLKGPYNHCRDYVTFEMNALKNIKYPYHQFDCFQVCRYQKVAFQCGEADSFALYSDSYYTNSSLFYENYNSLVSRCSNENNTSIIEIDRMFFNKGENLICGSTCPIECNTITYTITANYNLLFGNESQNKARLNIYYDSFRYTSITQIPKAQFEDLFANIGGILGLFLGVSLLSFMEVVELLIHFVYICCGYSKNRVIHMK